MQKIGIDFGTGCTTAAYFDNGKLELIHSPFAVGNNATLLSSTFIDETNKFIFGQVADKKRNIDPTRYKSQFKRDFGQTTPYAIAGKSLKPEDLVKELLKHFREVTLLNLAPLTFLLSLLALLIGGLTNKNFLNRH